MFTFFNILAIPILDFLKLVSLFYNLESPAKEGARLLLSHLPGYT